MAKFAKFNNEAMLAGLRLYGNKKGSLLDLTRYIRANVEDFDSEPLKTIKSRVNSRLNAKKKALKEMMKQVPDKAEGIKKAIAMLTVTTAKKGRQPEDLTALIGSLQNIADADNVDDTDEELDESDAELESDDEELESDESDDDESDE